MAGREPKLGEVAEVANAIQLAAARDERGLGRTIFFIGAGCSKSAGIPLVPDMAQQLIVRLAKDKRASSESLKNAEAAYRWLTASRGFPDCRIGEPPKDGGTDARIMDWARVYDVLFGVYYKTPDHAREIFADLVDQSGGRINWAHLCVGELVRQRLISTVITTNFDQLVLAGLVCSGVLPVVCDGTESLTRIRGAPLHPQLIELHGSRHTYQLRNAPEEVEALINDSATIAAIESLFQELRVFVAVGYGGREKGIMELLIRAASRFTDKQLFWVVHGSDPAQLSENARRLLATSRNAALLVGQDADSFFVRLLKELGVGAPEAMREPLFLANLHASLLAQHDSDSIADRAIIVDEIKRYRSEIEVLKRALENHRKERSATETAIVQARELRLAGRLADAMQILQAASTCSDDPTLWHQLANVANELGRDSADRSALEFAITAWHNVLGSIERNRDPFDWASAQNNLGLALSRFGEREKSTVRLEEAAAAFREALAVRTREHAPLDWATTQNNLGNALAALGELEGDSTRLDGAAAAYREALNELPRERVPLEWARTQNNIGTVLRAQGENENDTGRLKQAIEAFRAVLEERTRERVPLQWAMTQSNLGNALATLGEYENDAARFDEAIGVYREALKVFEQAGADYYVESTRRNLAQAETLLTRCCPKGD